MENELQKTSDYKRFSNCRGVSSLVVRSWEVAVLSTVCSMSAVINVITISGLTLVTMDGAMKMSYLTFENQNIIQFLAFVETVSNIAITVFKPFGIIGCRA